MTNKKSKIHWLLTAMLLVAAMLMPMGASAAIQPIKPFFGDGSSSNPYQISVPGHLYWFAGLVNGTLTGVAKNPAACAKLMDNITVNKSVLKSDGTINSSQVSLFTAWTPIGYFNSSTDNVIYTGTFDGNGKIISGLYYEDDSKMYIGLFGYSSGTIKNVGVIDTYFHCNSDLGGICGYNLGTVSLCFSKSYLYVKTYNVGGVCGVNYTNATITNCYHIGTIYDWEPQVGGVCGYNYGGNISYCYHIGNLENANNSNSGGVCGKNTGTITKCYYDKDKCSVGGINRADAAGQAEGKTTAQFSSGEMAMVLQGSQSGTVWGQTIGTDSYPVIGGAKVNCGYPVNDCIRGYTNSYVTATPNHASVSNGFCSRCNGFQMPEKVSSTHHAELNDTHNGYYAIENAGQFYWFAALVDGKLEYMPKDATANAVLTASITVNSNVLKSDGSLNTDKSDSFRVMPQIENGYSGTFDGKGYTIGGLYVNNNNNDGYLFNSIDTNGKIKNLGIVDSYLKTGMSCAGLCSTNSGLLLNCYNSTIIANKGSFTSRAVGFCYQNYGRIERCYNTGQISSQFIAAGVCIDNYGVVVDCYNTGGINGYNYWGGIAYNNYELISNCYSSSSKMSEIATAGSICCHNNGTISNCYYDKDKCSVGCFDGDGTGQAEGKTTAQFNSGEVAYLLGQGCTQGETVYDGSVWGQTIGTDNYPVIGGPKVYYGYPCNESVLTYSNFNLSAVPTDHNYINGFCKFCDNYHPATAVSSSHHPELNDTHNGYYAIENAGELYWFAKEVNSGNKCIKAVLTTNIIVNTGVLKSDGTLADNANEFRSWTPIGFLYPNTEAELFNGMFDGNGKTISGLYFNRGNNISVGLVGYADDDVWIKNVGIVDTYFNGYFHVGGVCGDNSGKITNCYSNAVISGTSRSIGGVCGYNNGTLNNSYFSGIVSDKTGTYIGSVCGEITKNSIINNCYYDKDKSSVKGINGANVSGEAEGKTFAQFQSGEVAYLLEKGCQVNDTFYEGSVWGQLLGTDEYPVIDGSKTVYYGYTDCDPNKEKIYSNMELLSEAKHVYANGFCSYCDEFQPALKNESDYYEISNAGQLYWFANLVNSTTNGIAMNTGAKAKLLDDIVVNEGEVAQCGGTKADGWREWTPMCKTSDRYEGIFDGNGHTISGLFFNDTDADDVGFFSYVKNGGIVKNMGVVNSYLRGLNNVGGISGQNSGEISECHNRSTIIASGDYSGGLCGENYGSIINSYNLGEVSGSNLVGGVCGSIDGTGEVENCKNMSTVSATTNKVGGISGQNTSGTIRNSKNTGKIIGVKYVGGICGLNYSTITAGINEGVVDATGNCAGGLCGAKYSGDVTNSYNIGSVKGGDHVGGILGYSSSGSLVNCFNASIVSGSTNVGGVCGNNYSGTLTNCYHDRNSYGGQAVGSANGTITQVEGKATACFENGEVAYLLAQGTDGSVWGQQLGVDNYPVLNSDYKLIVTTKGNNNTYWSTFSNLTSDVTLSVPEDRKLAVYNATVSDGTMTLTGRTDNQVAFGEGVLLKTDGEYVNVKENEVYTLTPVDYDHNNLVATPATEQTINAETGYKLYRLTYNKVDTKEGLGFYLGLVKDSDGNVTSDNGSQLKATPGKAYLNVTTEAATKPANAALTRGFVFSGDDETTAIDEIVIEGDAGISGTANADGRIYNLQGQQVTAPAKGLYIKNNKKVLIK